MLKKKKKKKSIDNEITSHWSEWIQWSRSRCHRPYYKYSSQEKILGQQFKDPSAATGAAAVPSSEAVTLQDNTNPCGTM